MGHISIIFMFLFCLLPAVPFTQSVVDDSDSNLIYLWAIRAGAKSYAVAYFMTVLLKGFCTVFLGSVLSISPTSPLSEVMEVISSYSPVAWAVTVTV